MSQSSVWGSSATPFKVVFLMWVVFYLELVTGFPFTNFGIVPLTLQGVIGIFVAPLLHGNLDHLISNTIPLLFLGTVLFFFYPRIAGIVFLRCWFLTNLLVWLFAWRQSSH